LSIYGDQTPILAFPCKQNKERLNKARLHTLTSLVSVRNLSDIKHILVTLVSLIYQQQIIIDRKTKFKAE